MKQINGPVVEAISHTRPELQRHHYRYLTASVFP